VYTQELVVPNFHSYILAAAEAADVPVEAAGADGWQWGLVIGVIAALFVALLFVDYRTQAGVIARATTKEAIRQPVFLMLLGLALLLLVVNTFLPFFTFGEDVKMLKDCGLATILVCGLLLAVWTASSSIADEIEGKTAMTLLSKPINRREFIVGKYLGIVQTVLWMLIPLAIVFLFLIYYKVGYDAREASKEQPPWFAWIDMLGLQIPLLTGDRLQSIKLIMPGIALIFLEITVLTACSVAISTRLPTIVNIVSCIAIFVVGHLTPMLVQQNVLKLEFVTFMARLIATVLPSLEVFNTQAAVATGIAVPASYLAYSLLYCGAYSTAAILLAFILFEDRDLA